MELSREEKLKFLKKILSYSRRNQHGCLVCYSSLNTSGRPSLRVGDKVFLVTRLIMHIVKDFSLKSELFILHDNKCDSPCCIDVEHLRQGTRSENQIDRLQKDGHPSLGKRKPFCKRGHARTPKTIDNYGACLTCQKERNIMRRKSEIAVPTGYEG